MSGGLCRFVPPLYMRKSIYEDCVSWAALILAYIVLLLWSLLRDPVAQFAGLHAYSYLLQD